MRRRWRGGQGGSFRAWLSWLAVWPAVLAFAAMAQEPAPPGATPAAVRTAQFTPAQAATALKALQGADAYGLSPKAYVPEGALPGGSLSPEQQAALTRGVLRYARDVRVGRLALGEFPFLWGVRPQPYDPAPELARALAEHRLQAWLDDLHPPYAGYHALVRGLARYRALAEGGGWPAVPEGPPLKLGSADPRVAALRARLAAEDPQVARSGPFDQALHEAVMRAQRRMGLKPDGVVGPSTLAALNRSADHHVQQIVANMERWRWLPREMPATRVQVNSGAAIVTLFREDKPVLSMKAVSGKPGDETPIVASVIHSIVINPPWNVPSRIAREELWPKERASPGYFRRNGFAVIRTEGGSRLQQRPGPNAALGRFKFDFDNDYVIYLHDTPTRATFDLYERQASHGCVRLEKAQALAEALLDADAAWQPEAIEAALAKGETIRVPLPEPVPVFILYWTAFAGPDGQMHFRADPYNWDRLLLEKIGATGEAKA